MFRSSGRAQNRRLLSLLSCCAVTAILCGGCVKMAREAPTASLPNPSETALQEIPKTRRININTATREELEKLPNIGAVLAARIIEHRARYGAFRRVEHLLIVRGVSERRFREMRPLIYAE